MTDLKTRREAIHLSISGIADKFGVSIESIQEWESGAKEMPFPEIVNLAMRKLEDDFEWDNKLSPSIDSILDKAYKGVRRADAVLAGVAVE